jgi:Sigma-70 region 2
MSESPSQAQDRLFAQMDAKVRDVIEKRFGVKLGSAHMTEKAQAAWDVYQNATVKTLKAINAGARIEDAASYAATIARNSCRDYWRIHNPGWADLKGRLSRFFRKQPGYRLWDSEEMLGWICGPAGWESKPLADGGRVSALIAKPRRIRPGALPKSEVMEQQDAAAWDMLLQGFFEYLGGPVRLDDMVSIAGVLFGVRGAREMAFDELAPSDEEEGRAWEPAARQAPVEAGIAIRDQLRILWENLKAMPKRWVVPFLLNPPVMKGAQGRKPRRRPEDEDEETSADRGEIEVFTANGIATMAEMEAVLGFGDEHYALLWRELDVAARGGPRLETVSDPHVRFAVIWKLLPIEDHVIAKAMGLESAQKVINLRLVARNHLAKVLVDTGIPRNPSWAT